MLPSYSGLTVMNDRLLFFGAQSGKKQKTPERRFKRTFEKILNSQKTLKGALKKGRFLFLLLRAVRYAFELFRQINNNPVTGECSFLICYLPGQAVSPPLG
ncbi:hypothetical protein PGS49_23105, partial [Yersinia intermedia]|uniref:hypothetical protein n=1 Tax=Yersinia intermedia TaxID=631 RepID=UPI0022FDF1DE